jgi:hypothetical protein
VKSLKVVPEANLHFILTFFFHTNEKPLIERLMFEVISIDAIYLLYTCNEYSRRCLFFYDFGISMFRPSMVLNQRQVSLVVSD